MLLHQKDETTMTEGSPSAICNQNHSFLDYKWGTGLKREIKENYQKNFFLLIMIAR